MKGYSELVVDIYMKTIIHTSTRLQTSALSLIVYLFISHLMLLDQGLDQWSIGVKS